MTTASNAAIDTKRHLIMVALTNIHPSATNPRKTFPESDQAELIESIREHGVLSPLLLRPSHRNDAQDNYELVAGERRYRAASSLMLDEVPCMIANLTDREVLEIQIVENLQRRDLDPLEEAEGYELMMKEHNYSAEELAEKIGKSKAYVYARAKLCDLTQAGREALRNGLLSASTALLVARIPVPSLQDKAVKELTAKGEPMSARSAAVHIQNNYSLDMTEATWPTDDADLIPLAGACDTCPKRTSVNRELFADISADVCTDPDCFAAKNIGFIDRRVATLIKGGFVVIQGEEAATILKGGIWHMNDYVALDNLDHWQKTEKGYITPREWIERVPALKKLPITTIQDPDDKELFEVIRKESYRAAIDKHIKKQQAAQKSSSSGNTDSDEHPHNSSQLNSPKNDHRAFRLEQERAFDAAYAQRIALRESILAAMDERFGNGGTPTFPEDLAFIAETLFLDMDDEDILDAWQPETEGMEDATNPATGEEESVIEQRINLLRARIPLMTAGEVLILLTDMAINSWKMQPVRHNSSTWPIPAHYAALLKRYNVPLSPDTLAEEPVVDTTPAAQAEDPTAPAKSKTVTPALAEWPFPSQPNGASTAAQAGDTDAGEKEEANAKPAAPAKGKTKVKAASAAVGGKSEPKIKDKQSSSSAAGGKGKTADSSATDDDATVERCANTADLFEPGQTDPAEASA